jgi:hypothetical protein
MIFYLFPFVYNFGSILIANIVVRQMYDQIMGYPYHMNNQNASKKWFGI